jgi:hypothetical protein
MPEYLQTDAGERLEIPDAVIAASASTLVKHAPTAPFKDKAGRPHFKDEKGRPVRADKLLTGKPGHVVERTLVEEYIAATPERRQQILAQAIKDTATPELEAVDELVPVAVAAAPETITEE